MATWKEATIDKYVMNAAAWLTHYIDMPFDELTGIGIRISAGDTKLGTVPNYSLLPVLTCKNCQHCRGNCYDLIPCIKYPQGWPIRNRAINTALVIRSLATFQQQLEDYLRTLPAGSPFRPHQGGEFFSEQYFAAVNEVIGNCPGIRAWTYTTMDIYTETYYNSRKRPDNFSVMLSTWPGSWEPKNSHGLPQYFVRDTAAGQTMKPGMYICPGNCQICLKNGRGCPYGENVQTEKRTAGNSRKTAKNK